MKTKLLLLTFVGGAFGSLLRYLISLAIPSLPAWLWIVNLLGAFVLGFAQVSKRFANAESQSLIATGFAGGFTTMSSLVTFAMLGNDPNFLIFVQQIGSGVAVYWIGRIVGGERDWPSSW